MLPPTVFPASLDKAGPKHSTRVSLSMEVAVPLSVDEKERPNPVPILAVKTLLGPHVDMAPAVLCARIHSLLPFTLQMVTPLLSPLTVHLNMKVSPGQMGGAAVNCPATSPRGNMRLEKNCCLIYYKDNQENESIYFQQFKI